jgi:hypothetical protein
MARGAQDEPRRETRVPDPGNELQELRASYRATKKASSKKASSKKASSRKARLEQKATLEEALVLNESLAEQISAKLVRLDGFRARLISDAQRCRELLDELE